MDQRKIDLANWARHQLIEMNPVSGIEVVLQNLSGDASFRRYFRALLPGNSYVLVDAPPEKENSRPFAAIAQSFRQAGLHTPEVLRADFELGFLLLEDFGDQLYLPVLQQSASDRRLTDSLYDAAINALVRLQSRHDRTILPPYNRELLHREMQLFEDWFCSRFLELDLNATEKQLLAGCLRYLEDAALEQTQVAVHRDYHSRNLMIVEDGSHKDIPGPGVLDFQDAVTGPYTYDLVSLLRDCYIKWPKDYVRTLALRYKLAAEQAGIIENLGHTAFFHHFDLMGLQRHLKVIGIFARLSLRDNKPQYLADIPLVIEYFLEVAGQYRELAEFVAWFETVVMPRARSRLPAGTACAQ
ncbi:MAG: phosphotransferase [Pseudohongiellaceae bacterium]